MNMEKDPYEILGVKKEDTMETIDLAYRRLLKKYDLSNYENNSVLKEVAQRKLKEITEAYEYIIAERQKYKKRRIKTQDYLQSTDQDIQDTYDYNSRHFNIQNQPNYYNIQNQPNQQNVDQSSEDCDSACQSVGTACCLCYCLETCCDCCGDTTG